MSRYSNITNFINNSEQYSDLKLRKKIKQLNQYELFNFGDLKNINDYNLDITYHVYQNFDRLYNISYKYYASAEYGWLICYTNNISNEFDIKPGRILKIYFPLNNILGLI